VQTGAAGTSEGSYVDGRSLQAIMDADGRVTISKSSVTPWQSADVLYDSYPNVRIFVRSQPAEDTKNVEDKRSNIEAALKTVRRVRAKPRLRSPLFIPPKKEEDAAATDPQAAGGNVSNASASVSIVSAGNVTDQEGDLRLTKAGVAYEGLTEGTLEIAHNGEWIPFCGEWQEPYSTTARDTGTSDPRSGDTSPSIAGFDDYDAHVACGQLGFVTGYAGKPGQFDDTYSVVWLGTTTMRG
jgi:hypothetical protein